MARDNKPPAKTAGPSDEDLDLWRRVTSDARPLPGREAKPRPPATPPATATAPVPAARPQPAPPGRAKPAAPELATGTVAGVDRRTAERLRRGQLAVEATLDLHGHTQSEAHAQLQAFLARCHNAGKRCVLVITGRGVRRGVRRAMQRGERREDSGVLRRNLPHWLNEPANRARILAFATAQPKHGGSGALYVLMRRPRADLARRAPGCSIN